MSHQRYALLQILFLFSLPTYGVPDYNEAISGSYQAPGFSEMRDYQKGAVNEVVDPYSGNVKRIYTDYVFPDNGGMDVVIKRYYQGLNNFHSRQKNMNHLGGIGPMGSGWDVHFGRVWVKTLPADAPQKISTVFTDGSQNRALALRSCRTNNMSSDKSPVLELPDGGRQVLFDLESDVGFEQYQSIQPAFITQDHWLGTCIVHGSDFDRSDGGVVLHSPDGRRYVFNKLGRIARANNSQYYRYAYLLTQIQDLDGNTLDVSYKTINGNGISLDVIDTVTTSGGVNIVFEYDTNLMKLKSISGEGVKLLYRHNDGGVDGWRTGLLDSVKIADELTWRYDYYFFEDADSQTAGFYNLKKATSPFGQNVEYFYRPLKLSQENLSGTLYDDKLENVVVSKRIVEDGGVWEYAYSPGGGSIYLDTHGETDITTVRMNNFSVVSPPPEWLEMCIRYEHLGEKAIPSNPPGASGINNNLYRRGQLINKKIYNNAGCNDQGDKKLLKSSYFEYKKKAFISSMNEKRPLPLTLAENTWKALITRKTITLGGESFITDYHYDDAFAYDYLEENPYIKLCGADGDYSCSAMRLGNKESSITESSSSGSRDVSLYWVSRGGHPEGQPYLLNWQQVQWRYQHFDDAGNWFVVDKSFNQGGRETYRRQWEVKTYSRYSQQGDLAAVTDADYCNIFNIGGVLGFQGCPEGEIISQTLLFDYYRGRSRLIEMPDSTTITQAVDDRGNVTSRVIAKPGEVSSQTDYEYDFLNRITEISTPEKTDYDISVKYINEEGITKSIFTRGDYVEETSYNSRGLIQQVKKQDIKGVSLFQNYKYDDLDHRVFTSHWSGNAEETAGNYVFFDVLGRPVKEYHTSSSTGTNYVYLSGLTAVIIDEMGFKKTLTYDAYGDPDERYLTQISQEKVLNDPAPIVTTLERNTLGRLKKVIQGGLEKVYQYGGNGSSHMKAKGELDPFVGLIRYQRNRSDDLTGYIIGNTSVTKDLDTLNRTINVKLYGGSEETIMAYDKSGNLKAVVKGVVDGYSADFLDCLSGQQSLWMLCYGIYGVDAYLYASVSSRWEYRYNLNNQLVSEELSGDGLTGFVIGYEYDLQGYLEQIHYGNGVDLVYTNDAFGRPLSAVIHDPVNGNHVLVSEATYHPDGGLDSLSLGSGVEYKITLNSRLWPENLSATNNVLAYAYEYDSLGNVTGVSGDVELSGFEYDGLSRLNRVSGAWGVYEFDYSEHHSLVRQMIPGVGDVQYNYAKNLEYYDRLELVSLSGAVGTDFSYDSAGNMIHEDQKFFAYDDSGRLTSSGSIVYVEDEPDVNGNGGGNGNGSGSGKKVDSEDTPPIITEDVFYQYDGNNNRIKKSTNGVNVFTVYNREGSLIHEYDHSGSSVSNYYYFNGRMILRVDYCNNRDDGPLFRCPALVYNEEGYRVVGVRSDLISGSSVGINAGIGYEAASFSLANDCDGAFQINATTGNVTVKESDLLVSGTCILKVVASAEGKPDAIGTFIINIIGIDGVYKGHRHQWRAAND